MKTLSAALAAAALLATAASVQVNAQVLDLSTIKCKDFIASKTENVSLILMWLQGYYSDEDDPPIVDFDKMKKSAEELGAYCGKNPEVGLITAADKVLGN